MEKTNIKWYAMTDAAILTHIGTFVKDRRIERRKTQQEIANTTGLNRYTIGKIENGGSVTLLVLIQVLRALEALYILDEFSASTQISPLEAVKLKDKTKQRVRPSVQNRTAPKKSDW